MANNEADEAKDEEKLANVRSLEHEQIVQKTQADKKRKLMQDQAQAVGNRTCSKTKEKLNSSWKSSKTSQKCKNEGCGHQNQRRRPSRLCNSPMTQTSSGRNMSRTRKTVRTEQENENSAKR